MLKRNLLGVKWVERQRISTCLPSSPVVTANFDVESSSDEEEYEGFLESNDLLLSDVPHHTKENDVINFFQGFTCHVLSRKQEKDKTLSFAVHFETHGKALEASERYKRVRLNVAGGTRMHRVSLTRSFKPGYKAFAIKNIPQNLSRQEIQRMVKDQFSGYGKVLHLLLPPGGEDCAYLYLHLNAGTSADKVKSRNVLQIRQCNMKSKVTKRLSYIWEK